MITKTNPDEIQSYLVDAANFKGNCSAVYFPETHDDIVEIVKEANNNKTEITVAGNRTGLTGSGIPSKGIVISTEKLNRILEINKDKKYAIVQPGVLLSELQDKVSEHGLLYAPDPTETNCFIGGTVATNASGSKSFKYDATRNFVEALKIILPDGEQLNLVRGENFADGNTLILKTESAKKITIELADYKMPSTKNAAGYFSKPDMDAIDLFIGSEGTLGIFSEIKIRLIDKPENILSAVIFFNDESSALNFIDDLRLSSLNPKEINNSENINVLGLEYFDKNSLKFLESDYPKIPDEADAAVWIEHETNKESEERIFNSIAESINKHNGNNEKSWFALNLKDRKGFQDFRHAVSWKVSEYITKQNVQKVGTDSAVPVKHFRIFYDYIKGLAINSKIAYLVYGHFGDCHVHLNLLPKNNDEYKIARDVYRLICQKAIDLNGTISAEHGIGKLKHEYLEMMYGRSAIKQMAKIKKELDPNFILCIGNIFSSKYLIDQKL
ncbi:MAG: FAD-binding oxidoreductase [Ignavibacteriae bacterium]|nr:FAD-binding oxidoreductase [Ignavibacteriota bacterium]NOG96853.1 FAD-binding oxidoreductase [Ignavibacteriota bacterium]